MLSTSVLKKLNNGMDLSCGDRKAIFGSFYDICLTYNAGKYPGRRYVTMLDALFLRWKNRSTLMNMSESDAFVFWKRRLRDYFKTMRRPKEVADADPEVAAAKQLYGGKRKVLEALNQVADAQRLQPKKIIRDDHWGVQNFLPPRRPDLDDEAIDSIVERLDLEFNLPVAERNSDSIAMGMETTLSERRRMIVSEICTLQQLYDAYPILFEANEWLNEFTRLTYIDLVIDTRDRLEKFSATLFLVSPPVKSQPDVDVLKAEILKCSETTRDAMKVNAALLALPLMLKDDINEMFVKFGENENSVSTPRIVAIFQDLPTLLTASEYQLKVENETVAFTDNFRVAFLLLFASFYVLNLQYPPSVTATLSYFQRYVVGLRDSGSVPQKTLTFAGKMGIAKEN